MSWSQVPTFVRDAEKRVLVNPAKQFIQPFELPMDKPNQIITLAPGATVGPIPLTAKYDGPIEVFFVKAVVYDDDDVPVNDYDIDFLLEHPGKKIQFMNRPTSLLALSGDAGRPYVLPETIFIPAVQCLNVTFTNNDLSNERKVELVLGGIKFYSNSADEKTRNEIFAYTEKRERTYTYFMTTDAEVVLAANDTDVPGFMTVPDDTDFEGYKLTGQSSGMFRCRIIDGQNDRGITGNKIHSSLLFGGHDSTAMAGGIGGSGGNFPARWATTFLIRRSVQLEIDFDDLSGEENDIKVIMAGRKIKYAS